MSLKIKHDPLTRGLDWFTTATAIAGSSVMAMGHWEGYWIILPCNIAGIWLQYRIGMRASLLRNAFFLLTTLIGIWNTCL